MNRSFLNGAALVLASGIASSFAYGQSTAPVTTGVSVRAGILFPFDSGAKNVGTTWLAYGAQYRLVTLNSTATSRESLAVSVDYFGRDGFSQTPVLLNYVTGSNNVFFTLGAGVGFSNQPNVSSGTDFAYTAGVGYNFPSTGNASFFMEARFWGSDRSELNAVAVYAGVHF